ncbi:hypothetical protein AB0M22_30180 [Nocardia sp. NPDC051756]|uniref:hypothetical protein n=1 Tax=Nocardia sp. NPDC051756 TaxID=3154751 RepID=UPI00342DDF3C
MPRPSAVRRADGRRRHLDRPAAAAAMYAAAAARSAAAYGLADDLTLTLRTRQILAGWNAGT